MIENQDCLKFYCLPFAVHARYHKKEQLNPS